MDESNTPTLPFSTESFIEHKGQLWLDARTIGEALGYEDPSVSINVVFDRNKDELSEYSTYIKLIAVDGKEREQRVFNEEGIYIISMLARTDRAKLFRRAVAKLLKKRRAEMIAQAHQKGMQDGITQTRLLESRLQKSRKDMSWLNTMVKYHRMGLNQKEIAKLMNTTPTTIRAWTKTVKPLGYLG